MNNLKQPEVTDCDYNIPLSTNKTIFWDTFGSGAVTPKYRNIPVCKTIDAIKVTGIIIENASGVKELKHSSNFNTTNVSSKTTEPILKKTKQSPSVAATKFSTIHRHQRDLASSSLGKQSSWSEPTLHATKDRGDSVVFEDICQEEVSTLKTGSKQCFSVGKSFLPKKKVMKGLLYIKNAGDIYKSEIEAKKLLVYEKDIFKCFPRLSRMSSTSKNLQTEIDEKGDFDLAIYLSGLVSAAEMHQKQNTKDTGRTQQKEFKIEEVRINKRKMSHITKSKLLHDETYKTSNQISTNSEKLKKAKKCSTNRSSHCKTRLSYQINKPNAALEVLGDDSDEEYELNESGDIVSKRKTQENLTNDFGDAHETVKPSDSGRLICKSRKSGTSVRSSKTRMASQYSLTHYGHTLLKPKMNEEEMWETFEGIFKSYASTSRHSGEVIPRKISTEWMMNAGIVNDILTQKQADDAFRSAAGAKITMNVQEYKEFLISLSLKLKLSYYEIYRRMCGM